MSSIFHTDAEKEEGGRRGSSVKDVEMRLIGKLTAGQPRAETRSSALQGLGVQPTTFLFPSSKSVISSVRPLPTITTAASVFVIGWAIHPDAAVLQPPAVVANLSSLMTYYMQTLPKQRAEDISSALGCCTGDLFAACRVRKFNVFF